MTTLFPQIKRVDEDETSKIIKNVLFNDQDEMKLEQIFDEFMHLTEESLTYSDEDDSDDGDDDDEDADDDDDDDDDESDSGDDDEDDDEDDEDDDEDEDDDDDDDDDDDNDGDEIEHHVGSREPKSWNLDSFLPVNKPITTHNESRKHSINNTTTTQATTNTTITTTATATATAPPTITATSDTNFSSSKSANHSQSASQHQPSSSGSSTSSTASSNNISNSYIVQIDLSKLKRIPVTKAPTPTISSSNMVIAKNIKHEADAEKDKTKQALKYLESAMYFVLHGYELETLNRTLPSYYDETRSLFKHVLRLTMPLANSDNMTNLKLHTLTLRCLSVLYMRLYKQRERELNENNQIIRSQQKNSPIQQADSLLIGIKPQLLSAYRRNLAILENLKYAHDYWQQADQYCDQHPAVRIFFSTIESNCGSMRTSSSFSKLMDQVKCGLKLLRTN